VISDGLDGSLAGAYRADPIHPPGGLEMMQYWILVCSLASVLLAPSMARAFDVPAIAGDPRERRVDLSMSTTGCRTTRAAGASARTATPWSCSTCAGTAWVAR